MALQSRGAIRPVLTAPASYSAVGQHVEMLVFESSVMGSVMDAAASIANRRSTVLILGETGTGKEMLARYIHFHSERASKPFVTVDCSTLTESLFESQLFGHVKGAFTGAIRDNLGFIRAADTGTLFIDEVGELPPAMQSKLLRVIQERAVIPVGDTRSYPVDVRVICATNRDIAGMVQAGTFREDLYFRINVITLHLPPLRKRPTDVIPLAKHFLDQQARIYGEPPKHLSPEAREALLRYAWPGNVRELANVIEHAHVLSGPECIELEHLPERLWINPPSPLLSDLHLVEIERRVITEALRRTKGNKAAAARLVGLNIQRFKRHLAKLKIELKNV